MQTVYIVGLIATLIMAIVEWILSGRKDGWLYALLFPPLWPVVWILVIVAIAADATSDRRSKW